MLNRIKSGLWVFLLAMSAVAVAQPEDFAVFSTLDGKPKQLESYTGDGKWLVVMIWASNCHICNAEAASYADFHQSQRANGIAVLGVSMDGEENRDAALDFVKRHELPFPNLIGEPGMIGLYYAALTKESLRGTPTFLIFDPEGQLAAAQAGAVPTDSISRFIGRSGDVKSAGQ